MAKFDPPDDIPSGQDVASVEPNPNEKLTASLNLEKLQLDLQKQRRESALLGRSLNTLQSLGSVIALAALVWTVLAGIRQQKEAASASLTGQVQGAYKELGDSLPSERLTGVAQLEDLLTPMMSERNNQTLLALVSQLTLEADPSVVARILTVLREMDSTRVSAQALNSALVVVIESQRASIVNSSLSHLQLALAARDARGFFQVFSFEAPTKNDLPSTIKHAATASEQAALSRLENMASALNILLRKGAVTNDFRGVYCPRCDFSGLHFVGPDFSGAVLTGANFERSVAEQANFHDSFLQQTRFVHASLVGASFDESETSDITLGWIVRTGFDTSEAYQSLSAIADFEPNFECADLSHASFAHSTLFVSAETTFGNPFSSFAPSFNNAQITEADFSDVDGVGSFWASSMPIKSVNDTGSVPRTPQLFDESFFSADEPDSHDYFWAIEPTNTNFWSKGRRMLVFRRYGPSSDGVSKDGSYPGRLVVASYLSNAKGRDLAKLPGQAGKPDFQGRQIIIQHPDDPLCPIDPMDPSLNGLLPSK